jgi:putative NADH-flavin reductase
MTLAAVRRYPLSSLGALAMFSMMAFGMSAESPAAQMSGACEFEAPSKRAGRLNILLVGASGMIGSRIAREAASRGHCVVGASRHPDKIAKGPNVAAVKLDATDVKAFTTLAKKADVIVSATSPRGGGDPVAEAKAVGDAAMAAARASGKRLIVVGGAASLNRPDGTPVMDTLPKRFQQGEPLGMRNVLDSLKASDIDWTFFSPAMSISPGERTGKYRLGTSTVLTDAAGDSKISAEDYAHALVNELEKPEHRRSQMTIAY